MNQQDSFEALYNECKSYCLGVLGRWSLSKEDAEDAFADAIVTYWIRKNGIVHLTVSLFNITTVLLPTFGK